MDEGRSASVSAYFVKLAAHEPDWEPARKIVDQMIEETGGIDDEADAWAKKVLGDDDDETAETA